MGKKKEGERVLQSEEKPRMKSWSLGATRGLAEYFAKGLEAQEEFPCLIRHMTNCFSPGSSVGKPWLKVTQGVHRRMHSSDTAQQRGPSPMVPAKHPLPIPVLRGMWGAQNAGAGVVQHQQRGTSVTAAW